MLLPSRSVDHWLYRRDATLWILGRCSTRIHLALRWYRQNLCSFSRTWPLQSFSSKLRWNQDVEEPFRGTKQNPRRHRLFVLWRLMTISSRINDSCLHEFFHQKMLSKPLISSSSPTNFAVISNICFKVRSSEFMMKFWIVEKFFPMNVAAFIVAAMNIPKIIECSSPDSATFDIIFCLFRTWSFTLLTNSAASLPMTKVSESTPSWELTLSGFPIHHESSLRTLRNAHFRGEEVLHDEGQLVASYPKKFSQVSLIDRAPQLHFSTLEKTKIDHNPLLNNLVVTVSQVSLIDRLPRQIFQDLDIHTRVLSGFYEVEDDTTEGILAVKFIIGLDFAVTRSSPDSCWARSAIAAVQTVEL